MFLTPEEKLILASVKIRPGNEELEGMDALITEVTDWNYFTTTLIDRGLAPLFHSKISLLKNQHHIPTEVKTKLRHTYYRTLTRGMVMHNAFSKVAQELHANEIQFITLKGIYLSEKLYGDIGLRQFSDIDLLVRPEKGEKTLEVIRSLGFRMQDEEESELEKKLEVVHYSPLIKDGVAIEVHVKLHLNNQKYNLDTNSLWQHADTELLNSQPVHALDIYDMLIHLCVHADHHMKIGHVQFTCFSDITNLLEKNADTLNWDTLTGYCQKYNAEKEVFALIVLVNKYMSATVPPQILQKYDSFLIQNDEALFCKYLRGYVGFRSGMRKHFSNFAHLGSMHDKILYAWLIIFPSRKFIITKFKIQNTSLVPLYYPYRWYLGVRGVLRLLWK